MQHGAILMPETISPAAAPPATEPLPDWLCQQLVQGTLPWDAALSYPEFCDRYTLCDSHWLGLFQLTNQAIACIRWDLLWIPDQLFHQIGRADAVYLFLKFEQLLGITVTPDPSANGAGSSTLPVIVRVELESVEQQQVLLIDDATGTSTTVVFRGEPHCLAVSAPNKVVQL